MSNTKFVAKPENWRLEVFAGIDSPKSDEPANESAYKILSSYLGEVPKAEGVELERVVEKSRLNGKN
ncbi:MAG: hypothetical protein U0X93_01680 [Anaerolineales bacterium]